MHTTYDIQQRAPNPENKPLHFANEAELLSGLEQLLIVHGYPYKLVASVMNISITTIVRKVKKYNLKPKILAARTKAINNKSYAESLTAFRVYVRSKDPAASTVIEQQYQKWLNKKPSLKP